jgi:hypothetical protein
MLALLSELADSPNSGKHLQLSLRASTGNGALDKAVGVGLGRVDLGILAGVLEALVPAKIYNGSD